MSKSVDYECPRCKAPKKELTPVITPSQKVIHIRYECEAVARKYPPDPDWGWIKECYYRAML